MIVMVMIVMVMIVMVMIVIMDLWTMVKVCNAVYLIYSFPAWRLEHSCECN
jgi:hypothetical protein